MPNHITTVLQIIEPNEANIRKLSELLLDYKRLIDFNKIIKSPACLENFEPHNGILLLADAKIQTPIPDDFMAVLEISNRKNALDQQNEISVKDQEGVKRAIKNYHDCGYMRLYEWRIEKWCTKWNAYNQATDSPRGWEYGCSRFIFDTASSHPWPIIKKLSELMPDVTLSIYYADKDLGNCGIYSIKCGQMFDANIDRQWRKMSNEQKNKFRILVFSFLLVEEKTGYQTYDINEEYEKTCTELMKNLDLKMGKGGN